MDGEAYCSAQLSAPIDATKPRKTLSRQATSHRREAVSSSRTLPRRLARLAFESEPTTEHEILKKVMNFCESTCRQ